MSLKNSTKNLSAVQPKNLCFPVTFTVSEYDNLTLNIPRALALADVLQAADQSPAAPSPGSMGECIAMLYELLAGIGGAWEEANDRRAEA